MCISISYYQKNLSFLQWLKRDFLAYLSEWQSSVAARDGFTAAEKTMMTLSRETLEGLRVTGTYIIYSIHVHVYQFLLHVYTCKYMCLNLLSYCDA